VEWPVVQGYLLQSFVASFTSALSAELKTENRRIPGAFYLLPETPTQPIVNDYVTIKHSSRRTKHCRYFTCRSISDVTLVCSCLHSWLVVGESTQ